MSNDTRTQSNVWLVAGTWGLVMVGLVAVWISNQNISEQLAISRTSLQRQWRPYLTIRHEDHAYGFSYRLGETANHDTVSRQLDEIAITSDEYMAVRRVVYAIKRTLFYTNSGATPLRITRMLVSTLSEKEWVSEYGKSAEALVDSIVSRNLPEALETDLFILPRDSTPSRPGMGLGRTLSKSEFECARDSTHRLVLYPYTYVEYEDFFENRYNVLLVEFTIFDLTVVDDFCHRPIVTNAGIEKYRWDISTGTAAN